MKLSFVRVFAALLMLASSAVFAQQDFSADIVDSRQKDVPPHISVAKDKMRIEAKQHAGPGGIVIMNFTTQTTDILIPERQMYIESVNGQGPGGAMMQKSFNFFRPSDMENACPTWQKMAQNSGGTCKRIGDETVNGRDTVKYEGTDSKGQTSTVWLDPKIAFPIKWVDSKGGSGELQNIKEGSQPASNFEIPSGYQKMDMGSMMQHMPQRQ